MPITYQYRARDRAGKLVSGEAVFENEDEARSFLRANKLMALELKAREAARGPNLEWFKRFQKVDLVTVVRQLAIMIKTGVPLDRTFDVLLEQDHAPILAEALQQTTRDVRSGASLSEAMEKHPKVFPDMLTSLVRAGETGGVLDTSLEEAGRQLVWQRELRQKVITAATYPVFTLLMTVMMVSIMLIFVVPGFVKIYVAARVPLPLPTQLLLLASNLLLTKGPFVVLGLAVVAWLFRRWADTTEGRKKVDRFKLKLPLLGPIFRKVAVASFCRTLALLMDAGVPILESLRVSASSSNSPVILDAIGGVSEEVAKGNLLAAPLHRSGEFPTLVVKLVAVGEMTGVVPEVLREIVHVYTVEVDEEIKRAVSLMEPIMVVFLAFIIGSLLTALYYPILNISKVATS
jgi:type IV pilus assembly protein PilC